MADIKFGAFSNAIYGDVVQSNTPTSKGLSLVPVNRFSGKPVSQTDVNLYGNNPKDVVYLLYKDGELARGLINNKVYESGVELSKEQIQAGSNVNYSAIAGELATLGLRTPTGTGGSQFVRDAAAEKKFVETVRANIKAGRPAFEGTASAGYGPGAGQSRTFQESNKLLSEASDEQIIASVGGVNKEGVLGSGYGINALYDPYASPTSVEKLPGGTGYGTGKYGGTGPAQYVRGSRQIVDKDIQELANISGKLATDPAAAARANQQLLSIFQNDSSWMRREQARDAMFLIAEAQPNQQGDRVLSFNAGGGLESKTSASTGAAATGVLSAGGVMTYTASDGRQFTSPDAYTAYQANLDTKQENRKSAYDLLYQQFSDYGLGALVAPLKSLIEENISPSEFTLRLRDTDAYKKRFAANAQRVKSGLRALSEAEYIGLEDQYQETMRAYGLPASYYAKGDMGRQEGFEKLIAGGVAPTELEYRLQNAYDRVLNAAPEVMQSLKQFYPDITNGDVLAFVLDPENSREVIKRKVTAAEIGAGAMQAGLSTSAARAEELQRYGVTGEAARQGFQTIGSFLPRATQLGDIYAKQGMGPFTQTTAEAEVFGTTGAVDAAQKRRKLSELEQAQFGGSTGIAQGALGRERAGQF
jgi:hypothetical protein